jgi:hypothetical protein
LGSGGLGLHLNKNPSGTYSFVGSVPVELSWERLDGKPMSDEEQKELLDMINHNAPYSYLRKSYKKVLFKTPKEGLAAAKKGGYKVSNADEFKAGS